MSNKSPDPRDVEVGRRVRAFRLEKGLTQEKLGTHLGLTFQQIQKYERGTNRIGAGRLHRIAEILGVSISDFFLSEKRGKNTASELFGLLDTAASLRLLRAYSRIRDPQVQQAVTHLVERIADS